jgi:hypothetical protein
MKSFPVKIPTLWRQAFPGLVLGALVARASLWLQGQPFSWPETWPLMLVAAAMVCAMYFFQPTQAGPAGLKAMQYSGLRRFVAWSEVGEVGFGRLYFIQPSLRLVDRQGRVYWIARDTRDLKGLHALARQFAGPAHPLTRALETPLFAL